MSLFTSSREKRLWLYTFLVLVAIISTLIFGGRLVTTMDQDVQGALFFFTMIALAATVILHGLITRPGKAEITVWLGLSAVYIMLYARLGFAERSHLFEYSVLVIFIHDALIERVIQGKKIPKPGLIAFLTVFAIGAIDEFIQLFLPSRVFDFIDILFNGLVAFIAIIASSTIRWVRKKKSGIVIGGIVFAGCLLLGVGVGKMFDAIDVGASATIGAVVGLICMSAVFAYYRSN